MPSSPPNQMAMSGAPATALRDPVEPSPSTGERHGKGLILAGILLIALNLRAAITGLGALLDEVSAGLGLSGFEAGVVTTLPTVAFAIFGAISPWLVRRFSPARVLVVAMVALAAGQLLRVITDSAVIFIGTSALALAGIAVGNILLPMLVKQYFPERVGLITGVYSAMLILGATAAAAAAVPIANAFGSWRAGLGAWALLALLAVLPWAPWALNNSRRRDTSGSTRTLTRIRPGRTRLGWAMAIYFGTQSLGAYATMGWLAQMFRDAGYSPETAGLLLAGITAFGLPFALLMPTIATRMRTLRPLLLALSGALVLSYVGLAVAPYEGAVLWVLLLAIGQTAFPLILAVIGLRARTAEGTVALSAFAQSIGFVIAASGPLLVGIFYEATGGWLVPIGFLLAAVIVQTLAGVAIARPRYIEDE